MDPNSSFKLKVKWLGNHNKCRQDMKCFYFDMVVDSDKINYEDLVFSSKVWYFFLSHIVILHF
jgi:hypothetical protein